MAEFTFWESKSIKMPMGPIWGSLAFMGALGVIGLLGNWAGSLAGGKETKFSGATLEELKAWEQTVASGDTAKMDELLQNEDGPRLEAIVKAALSGPLAVKTASGHGAGQGAGPFLKEDGITHHQLAHGNGCRLAIPDNLDAGILTQRVEGLELTVAAILACK